MKDYKKILLINYGGIGDEILFLPTIKTVKEQFPNAKISLALEPRSKSILSLTKDIDEIIEVDIKASGIKKYLNILKLIFKIFMRFDCVISSGKNPLVALILFLSGIKKRIGYNSKLGFLLTDKVELNENQYAGMMYHDLVKPISNIEYQNPTIELEDKFDFILEKNSYICIHPGVSKMSIQKNIFKCPKIDFWNELILGLLNKNKKVVLLGTNDDKDLIEEILKNNLISNNPNFINYFKKTKSLMDMASIMKHSQAVICVDSAPLHVAVCVNANTFAIFGPTNDLKLIPKKENIYLIQNNAECRPCLWHKRQFNCPESKCLNINPILILDKIN